MLFEPYTVLPIVYTFVANIFTHICTKKNSYERALYSVYKIVQYSCNIRTEFMYGIYPVSYTHLDVYKRQPQGTIELKPL